MLQKKYITCESVSKGHPDKICDQISDSILDACIMNYPMSRVAVETGVKDNNVFLLGEVTTEKDIDYENIVRSTIEEIGYIFPELGFDYNTCHVDVKIGRQSVDIAKGVDAASIK